MANVIVFHHALGRTDGFLQFVDGIREHGHNAHAPDVYDGRVFTDLDEGVAHGREIGFEELMRRGAAAVEPLAAELVYVGLSLGLLPAQSLAQTRPGARGAVLLHDAIPAAEFGVGWPDGVPVQIHVMEGDSWADLDAARALADEAADGELFVYPGDGHLFTDSSSGDYDPAAAALVTERVVAFLDRVS